MKENVRNAVTTERKYLDSAEAINKLSDQVMARLLSKAAGLAFGTGWEGTDLFHEAIKRVLDDTNARHCPHDVPFPVFLKNVMRSIASSERKKRAREVPLEIGSDDDLADLGAVAVKDIRSSENAEIIRIYYDEVYSRLQNRFANDQQVWKVFKADLEGCPAHEIRQALNMDETTYASVRRRMRRAIGQEFVKDNEQ